MRLEEGGGLPLSLQDSLDGCNRVPTVRCKLNRMEIKLKLNIYLVVLFYFILFFHFL